MNRINPHNLVSFLASVSPLKEPETISTIPQPNFINPTKSGYTIHLV